MQQALEIIKRPPVLITGVLTIVTVVVVSYFGATTNCTWFRDFSANLAAGALVAFLIGVFLTMYVQLSRRTAERQARLTEAYELLRNELEENLQQLGDLRKAWRNRKLLLATFETGQGKAILQEGAIAGEHMGLVSQLFTTYEALSFFNHVYKNLLEDPIRHGKLELTLYQHNQLNDPITKKFEALEALIRKTLDAIPQKGRDA